MSEEEYVEVKIQKATAEFILKQEWFKYYRDLEDFVMDAVRRRMEGWERLMRAYARASDTYLFME